MSELSIPVWTWRDAIRKSGAPPLTKLICLCIANYVSDVGKGAFPSVRALMADSSMSNRSVSTHIQSAIDAGLLELEREAGKAGRFGRTVYYPRFPDNTVLKRRADRLDDPEDGEDEPEDNLSAVDHVKEVHAAKPGEGASPGEIANEAHRVNLTTVHRVKEVHAELSKEELPTHTHASARARPAVENVCVEGGNLVDQLRAEGEALHVVEEFIAPLFGVLQPARGSDPGAMLRAIRDELAEYSDGALADAMRAIRGSRTIWPSPAKAKAAAAEAQAKNMIRIEPGTAQWAAWSAYWHASGKKFLATQYAQQGYARVARPMPPDIKRRVA
jgi:hypothetical protein